MIVKSLLAQHLLVAALVLGALVFLVLWLYCLRRKTRGSSPPLSHRWQDRVDELGGGAVSVDADLIGKPALQEGETVLEADQFGFADKPAPDKSVQLGLVADVQQEIKFICKVLAEKDGSKEDFFSMFEMIRQKYPKMSGHPALKELGSLIRERVPFHLSDEELDNLWT